MRALIFVVALTLASLAGSAPARAQEGHPLKGSWIGTWTGNKTHGNDVVLVLNWDGKDKGGAVVSYIIDGKIENLPLPNRTITGTWKSQKENGAFKIGRQ